MKKEELSFVDVEHLLEELARDDAQMQRMRGAAGGEIRRVFRRQRIRRVAGKLAVVGALGSTLWLLRPEEAAQTPQAEGGSSYAPSSVATASPLHKKTVISAAATPAISYENRTEGCELVIYSVPL